MISKEKQNKIIFIIVIVISVISLMLIAYMWYSGMWIFSKNKRIKSSVCDLISNTRTKDSDFTEQGPEVISLGTNTIEVAHKSKLECESEPKANEEVDDIEQHRKLNENIIKSNGTAVKDTKDIFLSSIVNSDKNVKENKIKKELNNSFRAHDSANVTDIKSANTEDDCSSLIDSNVVCNAEISVSEKVLEFSNSFSIDTKNEDIRATTTTSSDRNIEIYSITRDDPHIDQKEYGVIMDSECKNEVNIIQDTDTMKMSSKSNFEKDTTESSRCRYPGERQDAKAEIPFDNIIIDTNLVDRKRDDDLVNENVTSYIQYAKLQRVRTAKEQKESMNGIQDLLTTDNGHDKVYTQAKSSNEHYATKYREFADSFDETEPNTVGTDSHLNLRQQISEEDIRNIKETLSEVKNECMELDNAEVTNSIYYKENPCDRNNYEILEPHLGAECQLKENHVISLVSHKQTDLDSINSIVENDTLMACQNNIGNSYNVKINDLNTQKPTLNYNKLEIAKEQGDSSPEEPADREAMVPFLETNGKIREESSGALNMFCFNSQQNDDAKAETISERREDINHKISTINGANGNIAKNLASSDYDFEINDGIAEGKSKRAVERMNAKNKDVVSSAKYNTKDKEAGVIKFTNTENVGLIHSVALLYLLAKDQIDHLFNLQSWMMVGERNRIDHLFLELVCHIKLRKDGGNISLREYNDFLYTLEPFISLKSEFKKIKDLKTKTALELKLFVDTCIQNTEVRSALEEFEAKQGIDFESFLRFMLEKIN